MVLFIILFVSVRPRLLSLSLSLSLLLSLSLREYVNKETKERNQVIVCIFIKIQEIKFAYYICQTPNMINFTHSTFDGFVTN